MDWPRTAEESNCFPYYDFIVSICLRFDISFVVILIINNINFGLWQMVGLAAQDYYKAYIGCQPSEMTFYTAMASFPWSIKIFYGLITDNVPIIGLKRKPYLILFGLLQFVFMAVIFFGDFDSGLPVAIFLTLVSVAIAFNGVVVDAILVV